MYRFQAAAVAMGLLTVFADDSHAAVPVEGDVESLQLLTAAQKTNLAALSRGRMTARSSRTDGGAVAEATVIWDGPNTFWDYVYFKDSKDEADRQSGQKAVMIESNKEAIFYDHDAQNKLAIVYQKKSDYYHELKVRPDQLWFRLEGDESWSRILDASRGGGKLQKYVVRREAPDQIIVEMHYVGGTVMSITASLAKGANIVAYETLPGKGTRSFWRKGTYDWEQHPSGVWWLRKYEALRSVEGDAARPDLHIAFEADSFDPAPAIPKDRFTLASLKLPKGTRVEIAGENRRTLQTYTVGGSDGGVSQEVLDRLVEEAREGIEGRTEDDQ